MVSAQHYCVRLPFLTVVGVRSATEADLHRGPSNLAEKLLLLCQKKAGNDTGFESAREWCGGEEFGFLQGWENVFCEFISLGRRIKPCDLFWKGQE